MARKQKDQPEEITPEERWTNAQLLEDEEERWHEEAVAQGSACPQGCKFCDRKDS